MRRTNEEKNLIIKFISGMLDGVAGNQTLSKTVTLSKSINKRHKVVIPVQNKLKKLGYYKNAIDGSIGNGMTNAINLYQKEVMKYKKLDGKITAKGKMWKYFRYTRQTALIQSESVHYY